MKRRNQQAVALIVTLIMLSVITFMAVAFLFLSRREKGAVTTATDQTIARHAADAALERFKAETVGRMLAQTNSHVLVPMVPTNFINWNGFVAGPPAAESSPTNVNYDFTAADNSPLSDDQRLRNIANLFYDPRPPVYYSNEFRFYLDLNRNGVFDTNGYLPELSGIPGTPYISTNGFPTANRDEAVFRHFMGDPEYIGILERPDLRHSSTNRIGSRWTYVAAPADQTLDVNVIHNQSKRLGPGADGFLRNQGVGPWEINLAAFLADLNTNQWNPVGNAYNYFTNIPNSSIGVAFEDALSFLRSRYSLNGSSAAGNYNILVGMPFLDNPSIDEYANGPLMEGFHLVNDINDVGAGFPGAENLSHFFTPQEFFDPIKTSAGFTNRMGLAGADLSSYGRYTYYRMLQQLGTSSSANSGRMNVNYVNVDAGGNVVPGAETNQIPWAPLQFFTNAASRLLGTLELRDNRNFPITVTNIPIYPTNYYTPAVHRMLQLAANMHDATTNGRYPAYTNALIPSVFRPIFSVTPGVNGGSNVVSISGYVEVIGTNALSLPYLEATNMSTVLQPVNTNNVYGIPWIVAARKGYPNFNEFAMETRIHVTRKLEFRRPPGNPNDNAVNETNQMYLIGISNMFGAEAWNSYNRAFSRPLRIHAAVDMRMVLSNETRVLVSSNFSFSNSIDIPAGGWAAYVNASQAAQSFRVPLATGTNFLAMSTWRPGLAQELVPISGEFQRNSGFPVPKWWVNLRTRVRFTMVDTSVSSDPRIVDYVNLDDNLEERKEPLDITYLLMADALPADPNKRAPGAYWFTNRVGGATSTNAPTYGIVNQILLGYGPEPSDVDSFSLNPQAGLDVKKAIDGFRVNMGLSPTFYPSSPYFKSNIFYAPIDPSRSIYVKGSWQANDPLVHHTLGDLGSRTNDIAWQATNPRLRNLGSVNERYEPWGGNPAGSGSADTQFNPAVKDPGVRRSDDWDFPTNKLPGIGWLGRVHRGTPWQTVYMKSAEAQLSTWTNWAGRNPYIWTIDGRRIRDAELNHPTRDGVVFDFFTSALNPNAERGRMSINQTNLAAWSAVLSGVLALTNSADDDTLAGLALDFPNLPPPSLPFVIEPAARFIAPDPTNIAPVLQIVQGINRARAQGFPGGVFTNLGNILAVPELSLRSPFLNRESEYQRHHGITDAMYERIPQQVMSLLSLNQTPRYVVYSYGQRLQPAPQSVIPGGPYSLMVTNYQIMAETATRAVIRIEGTPDPRFRNSKDMYGRSYPPRVVVEEYNALPPD